MAEIGEIEMQQLAIRLRHRGRAARLAGNERHLAEELARAHDSRLRLQFDRNLARNDEIHAVAGLAAADDDLARAESARPEKLRHLGDARGTQPMEERDARDEVPGAQELAAPHLLAEARHQDGRPHRADADPAQHDGAGEQPPEGGDGHLVAIAHGGERRDRPPQRARNAAERIGLRLALEHVGERRGEHQHHGEAEEQAEQHLARIAEHPPEEIEARRVRHELQQPEGAEELRRRQRNARQQLDKGQGAGKIDDAAEIRRPMPARAPRLVIMRPVRPRRDREPQRVLDGEDDRENPHDRSAERRRCRADTGLRREDDGGDADRHRSLVRDPDRPRPRPLGRRVERLGELFQRQSHRTPSPDHGAKSNFIPAVEPL